MDVESLFAIDPNKPSAPDAEKPYRYLLIDGGGVIVTAWAACRNMERPEDRVSGAVYITITTLASLSQLLTDDGHIIWAWDGDDNRAYRRGMHPWYKHGRGSSIDRGEVAVAMDAIQPLLDAIGIATLKLDGTEADDMVATVATETANAGKRALIFSNDKDYLQLINDRIHVCRRSLDGIILSPAQCDMMKMDYGERYLAIKAMMGDSGDNIKGLFMIGEAKARKMIDAYPMLVTECTVDPDSADWDRIDDTTKRAVVRAGRRLVGPADMADALFARDFADRKNLPMPRNIEISERECLTAAAKEVAWTMSLVRMNHRMPHTPIKFTRPRLDVIPKILSRLNLDNEDDLLTSLMSLAHLRDPNAAPPWRAGTRAGDAVSAGPRPEDRF